MMKQPRAGGSREKSAVAAFGTDARSIRRSSNREGNIVGAVTAGDRNYFVSFLDAKTLAIGGGCRAQLAADQLIAVGAAKRGDLGAHVGEARECRVDQVGLGDSSDSSFTVMREQS